MVHVVLVMSISAIWKHAWSIPGSVLWVCYSHTGFQTYTIYFQNVLAGALFPPFYATILLAVLTALGSACSTLLSKPLGPFVSSFSPRVLDATRHALAGFDHNMSVPQSRMKASPAWVRLSILRLIGVVPWSGINIACGVCNVALVDCMLGAFLGCLPWTVVTCQVCLFVPFRVRFPNDLYVTSDRGYSPASCLHTFTYTTERTVAHYEA